MPGGRPSKYKPEMAEQARKLALLGATDREIADFFEVKEQTINNWKTSHPEFFDSLKLGKDAADDRVEQSLYRRALGYSHDEDDIRTLSGPGGSEIVITPTVKHYPPDTTACIFWLKNRRKEQWRDRLDHEVSGKDGAAIKIEAMQPDEAYKAMLNGGKLV